METWFWILGWILSILTITGNGFIIFLVISKRQLLTKTNAFIVSLAVADCFVGASVVPSLFFCDFKELTRGCNWSAISPSWAGLTRWLFGYASVINLCSLVLDRYVAVVKPLKYVTFVTGRRIIQMIFFSWAIPFAFVIIILFLYFYSLAYSIFINVFTMFIEIVSCSLLIFCFASMVLVICKHDRSAAALGKQLRFNHRVFTFKSHEKSAVIMMAIVVGLFLICYGMYFRCSFVALILRTPCNDYKYKIPMLVLNSAVNPWAYAFFKRDIKKEIKRLICRVTVKKDNKLRPVSKTNRLALGNSTL